MAAGEPGERNLDPGIRVVLGELRDLRVEMRADRQRSDEERRLADEAWREERRQADEAWRLERLQTAEAWRLERLERLQAAEAWRLERLQTAEERRRADEEWRLDRLRADEQLRQERVESQQRFKETMREFREDSIQRTAAMQKAFTDAFKQVHTVGLAIVKTLNRHTQILERIDRRLAAPGNGRRGRDNGRGR
jgi:hypothetical protein